MAEALRTVRVICLKNRGLTLRKVERVIMKNQKTLSVVWLTAALTFGQFTFAADKAAKPFIPEPVSDKQSIRFYKANKQLQADRVMITADKASSLGCNNFLKKVRVFKTLQIGFQSCALYEEKDCAADSLVPANTEKQERQTYILTEGQAWLAQGDDERGADVRSWYCGTELDEAVLRLETLLSVTESTRLSQARMAAKAKLEKAQAKFAAAEKDLKESRTYVNRVKKHAIAEGVIEAEEGPATAEEAKESEED